VSKSKRKTQEKSYIDDEQLIHIFENEEEIKRKYTTKDTKSLTIKKIEPLTNNQKWCFEEYYNNKNLILHGLSGTGKSFISLYLALMDILNKNFEKIIIVRSVVQLRDIGFTPGTIEEKISAYEQPYKDICCNLFDRKDAYDILKKRHQIEFICTSFLRGLTYSNCIILFDEIQNCTLHEISSVITRIGANSKIICCGDFNQSDLITKKNDRTGILEFLDIAEYMDSVTIIDFHVEDIVRSGICKEYLLAQLEYEKYK